MADKAAERIKYETEVLKTTVLVTVATTGGAISLLLGDHSLLRLGLAGVGVLITLLLSVGIWRLDRRIRAFIQNIKEEV
jgi:uncharacterized membrane protein YgaE (UPF0421/DUF939 family)